MEKLKINHKSDLIQIFRNLPFNKDINKLKKLLQWITNQYNINILEINRIKQYDKTIFEILNAIYKNIFDKIKDDFIIELKRTIRVINLNESKTMKKSELIQLIREVKEELLKENISVSFEDGTAYIQFQQKEIAFSSDQETIEHVIKALKDKQRTDNKLLWTSITSANGDIYIERKPGKKLVTIKQVEDDEQYETRFDIPVESIGMLINKLSKKI